MEPSLSEITSIKGDAAIAGGSAGGAGIDPTVLPADESIKYLNQYAQAKAQYNKYKQDQYHENLNNYLTDLKNTDFSKVLAADLPGLRQKYADLANNVGKNFDVIRNPTNNPEKFAELTQQEAELRGLLAQSQSHNAINTFNKNMIAQNPGWNTVDNQKKILDFENTPLEQRNDYLLKTPVTFNPVEYMQRVVAPLAAQKIQQESISHDKNWINSQEGVTYSKDVVNRIFKTGLDNTVNNGRKLGDDFDEGYNSLPSNMRKGLSRDQYLNNMIDSLIPQSSLSNTIRANPVQSQIRSENFQAGEAAKTRNFEHSEGALNRNFQASESALNRQEREDQAEAAGKLNPIQAGETKARAIATTFSNGGSLDERSGQNVYGNNEKVKKDVYQEMPVGTDENSLPEKAIFYKAKNKDGEDVIHLKTGTQDAPRISYTGSTFDAKTGKITVHRIDNLTGKPSDITRTEDDAQTDFNRIYGEARANEMGAASARFNKKVIGKENASLADYKVHFAKTPPTTGKDIAPKSGGLANDKYQEFLKKNGLQ